MKHIISILALILLCADITIAQNNTFVYKEKINGEIFSYSKTGFKIIEFKKDANIEQKGSFLDFLKDNNIKCEYIMENVIKTESSAFFDTSNTIKILKQNIISYCNDELICLYDSTIQWATNNIFIKLKDGENINNLLNKTRIHILKYHRTNNYDTNKYILTINEDPFKNANIILSSGMVEYVVPAFYREIKTCDSYYTKQWNINNMGLYNGTSGIDINIEKAWNIASGLGIKVAIIDQGVELTHPDLSINMLNGYDALGHNSTGACHSTDNHGTCCAGIIGALDNNIGIKGIAYNSKIIPIRFDSYSIPSNYSYDETIILAINYARNANADIINFSYSLSGGNQIEITNTINNAIINGRSGKGCVFVASAGNRTNINTGTDEVKYPANLNNVIAVGAINPKGERKSFTTYDGENWSSCYGQALNVVAPGILIPTTDLQGNNGLNPCPYTGYSSCHAYYGGNLLANDCTNTDYTLTFNGTSAAAPHISGIAALILSVNPNLTWQQVRNIIETTARKIRNINESNGLYSYSVSSDHPNGPWNNQVGYGLVNAHRAVLAAYYCYDSNITGYSNLNLCNEYSYGIETVTILPNTTFNWRVSDNLRIVSGQNSTNVTIAPTNTGTGTITFDFVRLGDTVSVTKTINVVQPGNAYINYSTNDNINISSDIIIDGTFTINYGNTVTISSTISCLKNSKIIIMPGGKLIIDGATISNLNCTEDLWDGIYVVGDTTKRQLAQYQGTLEVKNGSLIENAKNAIVTWDGTDYATSGGIVKCSNSTFRNNALSIEFLEYTNHTSGGYETNNVSFATKCTFVVDDNNLFASNSEYFDAFVTLMHVKGLSFNGSTFRDARIPGNNQTQTKGIWSFGAGYTVSEHCTMPYSNMTPCTCDGIETRPKFSRLKIGIFAQNDGTTYNFSANHAIFDTCYKSVFIMATNNCKVTRSDFNQNTHGFFTVNSSAGVYLDNSTGYTIEANNFATTYTTCPSGFLGSGVYVFGSGTDDNTIYRNNITNLYYGIKSDGSNEGLQLQCNEFSGTFGADINVSGALSGSQGSSIKSAGNKFTSGVKKINSPSTYITYYHSGANNSSNVYCPNNSSATIVRVPDITANNCASTICNPLNLLDPIKSLSADDITLYESLQQIYESRLAEYTAAGYDFLLENFEEGDADIVATARLMQDTLITIRRTMAEIANHNIDAILQDTVVFDREALNGWYNRINTQTAKYSLANSYFEVGEYALARQELAAIPQRFALTADELAEYDNFCQYQSLREAVYTDERNYAQLTEDEIAELQVIAERSTGVSSAYANSVLCFFYGICREIEESEIDDTPVTNKNAVATIEENETESLAVYVYPNPADEELNILLNSMPEGTTTIEFHDVTGRLVLSEEIKSANTSINISSLRQGVYMYRIVNGDNVIARDRIVKK